MEVNLLEAAVKENSDTMPIVQMSIRLDEELRNQVKILAINKGEKINDLLVKYISEGLERDLNNE